MKLKKLIGVLLSAIMVVSSITITAVNAENNDTENPLSDMTIPYTEEGYKIAGNITLAKEYNGNSITWETSDKDTISTEEKEFSEADKAEYGANYTTIPAGIVKRPKDGDKIVTLTAKTEKDGISYSKVFEVTVKKAPEMNYKEMIAADEVQSGVFTGYLYASFIEPAVETQYQQVYFAISDDGLNWKDSNGNKPVLTSAMGTKGLRDPYILRSAEGDRFYLLATDLDFADTSWYNNPSKNIMIWESDDLVNWSEQRSVPIADENTHYAWAPEAIYDELTGEYIVYWSGKDITGTNKDDPDAVNVVYYSKTRDFYSFTPQQKYVEPIETDGQPNENGRPTSTNFLDTTMIQGSDGLFYRTTKYEGAPQYPFVDVAKYPLGEFRRLKTNLDDENAFGGTEGAGWYRFNKDDTEGGKPKYGMMLDGYRGKNKGVGFFPNTVSDLNCGWEAVQEGTAELTFTRVRSNFKMRSYAKHGGIIPLTPEEYDRVKSAFNPPINYSDTKPEPYAVYDFEDMALSDINAAFTTGASLADDTEKGSKVLYLDGTAGSYMEFDAPKGTDGKTLERYTVSFDIKNNTTGNYFNFYIGDGSSGRTGVNYFGAKIGDKILLSSKDGKSEQKSEFAVSGVQGKWKRCDIVVAEAVAQIYIDSILIGECDIHTMENSKASKIRFGFSAWSADNASRAYYDNIYVYPDALSAEGLKQTDAAKPTPKPTPTPKSSITNARLTDENAEFTLNNAENYETATAYVAEYTENGTLAAVKCQDITIDSAVQKVTVPFAKKNAENSVKIMVWQDMKPLSDAVSLNNSAVPADYMAYYSFDGNYENGGSKSNVTTENVGVTKISNYSGNKVYGGSSPRSGVSSTNTAAYSDDAHDGKSLSLDGTYGIALDSYIPAGKSFTVSYWTKYSENPIGNLNGNPVVLFDGSDYSETRGGYHDLKYIQAISGAYNKTACHVKGISPRTDKTLDVVQTGRYDMDSVEWVMNTITYDAKTSSLRVYQNGVVTDSDSFVVNEAIQSDMYITVGADQWGRGYKGLVDDLYIYDRILTADEIASLYTPKKAEGFDEISQKQIIRRVEIPYKQLAETGEVYRCGVNYARAIQMQQEGEYKGRLYLTSEFYPDGRWDHHEFFPIWESMDYGESWQYVGKVEDTEHNKAQYVKDNNGKFTVKATEAQMADDSIEKDTYYGYEWRMRLQPTLYELPEDFGILKAGTLLCTGMSTTTETDATSDTDYDGDLQTSIDIFYSTDGGRSWEFYTHVMDGGVSRSNVGEPIWEPYLIFDNEYLYCLYSDERGMNYGGSLKGQKLVAAKINADSSINKIFDVLNMTNVEDVGGKKARPGMPVVAPLKEGGFVMTYENMNYPGASGRTYMKFGEHIDDWENDVEIKGTFIVDAGGGSPYVCVLSDGKVIINSAGSPDVFVFADKEAAIAGEYTRIKTCVEASYSRSIVPMLDKNVEEKLLIARGGSYWTTVDLPTGPSKLVTGVLDINTLYEQSVK